MCNCFIRSIVTGIKIQLKGVFVKFSRQNTVTKTDEQIKFRIAELFKLLGEDVSLWGSINSWFVTSPEHILDMLEWRIKEIKGKQSVK